VEKIKLSESQLEKIILKLHENIYGETLPIQQPGSDITIKYSDYQKIIQDLNKATEYFSKIGVKNDPEYADKFKRLNRSIIFLNKLLK